MTQKSNIGRTESTWNPITDNPDTDTGTFGPGFGVTLHPDTLTQPLRWEKPHLVSVNFMSDLFHNAVPQSCITAVFAVMAATPQHTYQILTKHHARMRSLLTDTCRCGNGHPPGAHFRSAMSWAATSHNPDHVPGLAPAAVREAGWPLPNVMVGVSAENQKWANIRIPSLLETPAATRFLSCEPLLGEVDLHGPVVNGHRPKLTYWLTGRPGWGPDETTSTGLAMQDLTVGPRVDWVIAGGESGPAARPVNPHWVQLLRDQCVDADIPFHFKQGEVPPPSVLDGREWDERPAILSPTATT